MKTINTFFMLLVFAASAMSQSIPSAGTWSIDKSHSKISFNVTHMAVSEVEGNFREFEGTVINKTEDFNGAEVSFTAKTASIDTDSERRDNHLKSPDFFEAEKYPEITFKGNLVKEAGKYKLKGNFTMHGVTRPVEFDVAYGGTVNTGRGLKAGFKVSGQINRQDYGLTWANKLATGEMVVSDTVDVIAKIELDKK
jgi:polyisoprenoid-binding protein YceI